MKHYTKAQAGQKGGSAKTAKKAAAAVVNGAMPCAEGRTRGRPRKVTLINGNAFRVSDMVAMSDGILTLRKGGLIAGYIIHRADV